MYYADDPVLLANEQTVMQDMIDRLTETGRRNGMEMNVGRGGEATVIRISRKPSSVE